MQDKETVLETARDSETAGIILEIIVQTVPEDLNHYLQRKCVNCCLYKNKELYS
jgi:hypothetical protein